MLGLQHERRGETADGPQYGNRERLVSQRQDNRHGRDEDHQAEGWQDTNQTEEDVGRKEGEVEHGNAAA